MLRRTISALFLVTFMLSAVFSAASQQSNDKQTSVKERFGGNWSGTFDGDASGKLTVSFNPGDDGKNTGKINVSPANGDSYQADFKTLDFAGDKFTAKYNDANGGEITLEGTSDGKAAQGHWSYRQNGDVVASGEWKMTKDVK